MKRRETWQLFVQHRLDKYLAAWPCARPTRRKVCPLHGETIGAISGICLDCFDGLYEQAAGDFLNNSSGEASVRER